MKEFLSIDFDAQQCRRELDRLHALLEGKQELSERDDLQPLFKESSQLAAFIGTFFPDIGPADRLAYDFSIFGDFVADIVVGNFEQKTFCVVELEDARPNSVFDTHGARATSQWGRRLEHGFSQLVDWFYALEDHEQTDAFRNLFGFGEIEFFGMLLIGRTADISERDHTRLRWRSRKVTINSHKVYCRTYDELYEALNRDWRLLSSQG